MEVKVVTKVKVNLTRKEYELLQEAAELLYYINDEIKGKRLEKEYYDLMGIKRAIEDFIYDDDVSMKEN